MLTRLLALNILVVIVLELTKILSLFKSPFVLHGISRMAYYDAYDYGYLLTLNAIRRFVNVSEIVREVNSYPAYFTDLKY